MGVRIPSPLPPTPGSGVEKDAKGVAWGWFFSFCSVLLCFWVFLAIEDLNCTEGLGDGGGHRVDLKAGGAQARAGGKRRCKP